MKQIIFMLALCAITLLTIGCKKPTVNPADVFNHTYTVTALYDAALALTDDGAAPTFIFNWETKQVNGLAGCNRYFASFSVEENTITFGNAGVTKMLCPNMATEDTFLNAFGQVKNYSYADGVLTLKDEEGNILITAN